VTHRERVVKRELRNCSEIAQKLLRRHSSLRLKMTTNVAKQIITGDGSYVAEALRACATTIANEDAYAIVAIMGAQSSGKSTLMNALFGTTFQEMRASDGRSQTTKGIWIANSPKMKRKTIAMDLEGSDGRERGEEDSAFEKQSALFALATADALLVNVWCHDIGREHASGKPLLRTIFEVNLRVFSPEKKRTILFVIRDRSKTPFEKLREALRADVDAIWRGISKPEKYKEMEIADLFDLKFTSLPHYEHEREKFEEEVKALRERFDAPTSDAESLQSSATAVPISGLDVSLREVWSAVKANKDLDLPAHKIMVATVRCEEIADAALARIASAPELAAAHAEATVGKIPQLGKKMVALTEMAMNPYDDEAKYFDKEVREAKRVDLKVRVAKALSEVAAAHLEHVRREVVEAFAHDVNSTLGDAAAVYALKKKPSDRVLFAALIKSSYEKLDAQWEEKLEESLPVDDLAWADFVVEETREFRKSVDLVIDSLRKERMNLTIHAVERAMERGVSAQAIGILEEAQRDMWANLRSLRSSAVGKWDKEVLQAVSEFDPDADETKRLHDAMRDRITEVVDAKARDAASGAMAHMKHAFARVFSKDSKGLPRIWRPLDDVAAINRKAQREALRVLALLAVSRLGDDASKASDEAAIKEVEAALYGLIPKDAPEQSSEVDATMSTRDDDAAMAFPTQWNVASDDDVVLSPADCRALWLQFESDTLYAVSQAMAAKEAARRALTGGAPIWMIALLIILGMNEIKWLLTHPVTLFCIVAAFLYARAIFNQLDVASAMALGVIPGLTILSAKIIPIAIGILKKIAAEGAASFNERPDAVPERVAVVPGHPVDTVDRGDVAADGVRRRKVAQNASERDMHR